MANFTDDELRELEIIFGLKQVKNLPVLDGRVTRDCDVWWREHSGPQLVSAAEHWDNIAQWPTAYSVKKPNCTIKVTYHE